MLRKLLPHGAIILSGMYLVFFLIDRVNSAMSFINNDLTKWLLLVLCAFSSFNAACLIHDEREKVRRREARAAEARRRREDLCHTRDSYAGYRR